MKLSELGKGKTAKIKKVNTDCNCVLRIMTLGLVEGVKVKHISSTKANMELSVYGTRLALSKHCANYIVV